MFRSQIPSLHESDIALYSASVLDNETVACFLDFHEIEPTPMRKVYAEVDLRSDRFSAQSESEKPAQVREPPSRRRRSLVEQR